MLNYIQEMYVSLSIKKLKAMEKKALEKRKLDILYGKN